MKKPEPETKAKPEKDSKQEEERKKLKDKILTTKNKADKQNTSKPSKKEDPVILPG